MTDPNPECTVCKGAGYYVHDVRYGTPQFAQLVTCECVKAAQRRQRTALTKIELGRHGGDTLDNFDPNRPTVGIEWDGKFYSPAEQARSLATALAQCYEYDPTSERNWLVLLGPYGSGKTHLAAATLAAAADAYELDMRYSTGIEFLSQMREGFQDNTSHMLEDEYKRCKLLGLDELGAERLTEWAAEKIYGLINYRYLHALPLVVTSNLTRRRLNELYPRLASRMAQQAIIIEVIASDYRQEGA